MRLIFVTGASVLLAATSAMLGCGGPGQEYHPVPKGVVVKEQSHEHEHGPHGGHLVELGEEEYHAELAFDPKTAKVTVYLLDSTAKNAAPIDAKEITLKLALDGKAEALALAAAPQSGDPQGKSSRFELADNADVKSHVKDEEDLKGSVTATIAGKSFSGEIKHEHSH
jgi:hypothetical protein